MEGFRAMERGDVEAIVALAHPDVEFVNPDTALEPGTRHGLDGLRGGMAAFLEAFEDLRFEYDRIVDMENCVAVTGTFKARGRGSGMELPDAPFAVVVTQRDGKLCATSGSTRPRKPCAPRACRLRASSGAASRGEGDSGSSASATIRMRDLVSFAMSLDALDLEGRVEPAPTPSRRPPDRASRCPTPTHWPSW